MAIDEQPAAPADPLTRAQEAYSAGNFAAVRAEAALARAAADPEVARTVRELERRISVDSWTWAVLGIALALFCAIVVTYAR